MLAYVLAIYINLNCPSCGITHNSAMVLTKDGISTVHNAWVETTAGNMPVLVGDKVVVSTDHDDTFHGDYYYYFDEVLSNIYE